MIPLKTTLTINAASSGATGLGLIILASPIAELFGVTETAPFIGVGIFLILFASFVLFVGVSKSINPNAVRLIITLDTLWVVASVALVAIASSSISLIGILTILAVAMWVAAMAFLQNKGMSSGAALIIIICFVSSLQSPVVAQPSEVGSSEINSDNKSVEAEALQIVNSFLEAVKEKSHAKAFPLLDSMIQWDQPGNNRFSGLKKGSSEVFGMFRGFLTCRPLPCSSPKLKYWQSTAIRSLVICTGVLPSLREVYWMLITSMFIPLKMEGLLRLWSILLILTVRIDFG